MYSNKIDTTEVIGPTKSKNSKECIICRYWLFSHGPKCQDPVCNGSHDLAMLYLNKSYIAIITAIGVDYHGILYGISKSKANHLFQKFNTCISWIYIYIFLFYIYIYINVYIKIYCLAY